MLKNCLGLAFFLVCVSTGIAAAQSHTEERPEIPADLYFEFQSVRPEDNAIINWRRAAEVEVPLDAKLTQIVEFCWTPGARRPSNEDLDTLRSWVRRDREALDLFDGSLTKSKAQWPEQNPQNTEPELRAMYHLSRARLLEADSLAEEKKFSEAVDSLKKSLKLADLGINGNASDLQYLLSVRIRSLVQGGMVRLAADPGLSMPLLGRLLKDLPRLDSESNAYSKVLRVDFTRYVQHAADVHKLAESWAKIPETNDALLYYPEDLRRPFKILVDPLLVAAHPKPFDEIGALNDDIRFKRIFRTNCILAWSNRNDSVDRECAAVTQSLREEIKPLMDLVKDEPLPLSKRAAERARAAYLQIENPIGRIFETSILVHIASDAKVFQCRTEREAGRAIIGLLIFERQKGKLPAKLSDLVEANILDSIPFDLFANAPLSYSRDRRIVWSVGEDGVDDGGEGADGLRWRSGDAVWKIPNIE